MTLQGVFPAQTFSESVVFPCECGLSEGPALPSVGHRLRLCLHISLGSLGFLGSRQRRRTKPYEAVPHFVVNYSFMCPKKLPCKAPTLKTMLVEHQGWILKTRPKVREGERASGRARSRARFSATGGQTSLGLDEGVWLQLDKPDRLVPASVTQQVRHTPPIISSTPSLPRSLAFAPQEKEQEEV